MHKDQFLWDNGNLRIMDASQLIDQLNEKLKKAQDKERADKMSAYIKDQEYDF